MTFVLTSSQGPCELVAIKYRHNCCAPVSGNSQHTTQQYCNNNSECNNRPSSIDPMSLVKSDGMASSQQSRYLYNHYFDDLSTNEH